MEFVDLRSLILFLIRIDDNNKMPYITIFRTKMQSKIWGVTKCKIDPIFSAIAAEKGDCTTCAPFYHHSLSIAGLKI